MALVRHGKTGQIFTKIEAVRFYASANRVKDNNKKKPKKISAGQRFDSVADSLAQRGYLRSNTSYYPAANVVDEVTKICENLNVDSTATFANNVDKFNFLAACFETFEHNIPNSQLHEIQSVEDAVKFYQTPVDTTLPLDAIKTMDLPENLHIQYDYMRYTPETDKAFNGVSAFPKSSTIVTGLKYKNKYTGHIAKKSWP